MLPPLLIGTGAGGSQREAAAAGRSVSPESTVANGIVREGPWVIPHANSMEEQVSEGKETGGSKGKMK